MVTAVAAGPAPTVLAVRGLRLARGGRLLVAGLDLALRPGELLAVAGPSGSGKSTLLRVLAGRERPEAGRVQGPRRGGIAVAFQDPGLPPALTARQAIACGRLHALPWWRGWLGLPPADLEAAALWAERLGIAHLLDRPLATASGGERQRAAVARALLHGGPLLLLDEPVSQLDPTTAARVLAVVRAVCHEGRAAVVVLHQPELLPAADRVLRLSGEGPWEFATVSAAPTPSM